VPFTEIVAEAAAPVIATTPAPAVAQAGIAQAAPKAEAPVAPVPGGAEGPQNQAPAAPAAEGDVPPADADVPAQPAATETVPADGEPVTDEDAPATGPQQHNGRENGKGQGRPDSRSDAPRADGPSPQAGPVAHAATTAAHASRTERAPGARSPVSEAVAQAKAPEAPPSAPAGSTTAGAPVESAPAEPAAPRGAVRLHQVPSTVETALQLASSKGITRARLQLHPAELGAIELHLRHTANGMTARVVADSAEAVTMLQQAFDDLKRNLEEAGIGIVDVEITARGDQRSASRSFAGAFGETGDRPRGGRDGDRRAPAGDADTAPVQTVRARLPLPGGGLVDVIA
jgi:flagellar hook-length control protein FliK